VRRRIEHIRPDGDLQDWLSKSGRAKRLAPPDAFRVRQSSSVPEHAYAYAYQFVTCLGTEGVINAWRHYVEWSDEFSIGQLWLSRGSGPQHQTLEVGIQTRRDSYGDWEPHVFVFYTTNNYGPYGDFLGGYDQDVKGWMQHSRVIVPGHRQTQLSQFGGQQFDTPLKVQLSGGKWWVMVNGHWMGYYPASLYNETGLRSEASLVEWGGEVLDLPAHPGTTATDMGSGLFPWEGYQRAAYMRNLAYQSDPTGTMARFQGSVEASNPDCYDISADFTSDSSWGSHFFWGGTGRNSACP
jgi:hypothetical protein